MVTTFNGEITDELLHETNHLLQQELMQVDIDHELQIDITTTLILFDEILHLHMIGVQQ